MDKLFGIHPKYTLSVKPKEGTRYNPVHDDVNGCTATIIDAQVGERGWIAYFYMNHYTPWHRLHTSTIESIELDKDGNVTITTRNTRYTLTKQK